MTIFQFSPPRQHPKKPSPNNAADAIRQHAKGAVKHRPLETPGGTHATTLCGLTYDGPVLHYPAPLAPPTCHTRADIADTITPKQLDNHNRTTIALCVAQPGAPTSLCGNPIKNDSQHCETPIPLHVVGAGNVVVPWNSAPRFARPRVRHLPVCVKCCERASGLVGADPQAAVLSAVKAGVWDIAPHSHGGVVIAPHMQLLGSGHPMFAWRLRPIEQVPTGWVNAPKPPRLGVAGSPVAYRLTALGARLLRKGVSTAETTAMDLAGLWACHPRVVYAVVSAAPVSVDVAGRVVDSLSGVTGQLHLHDVFSPLE